MLIGTILIVLAVMITTLLVVKLLKMRTRHRAAANVLFAKYTFGKLKHDEQTVVHKKSIELVEKFDTIIRGYSNDVERYGWYALAMTELEIPSAVPDNPMWYKVTNPYLAVFPGDMLLSGITMRLLSEYGIEVSVSAKNATVKKARSKNKKK